MYDIQKHRERTWGSADGKETKVKDLAVGHLVNILNWIEDNSKSYSVSTRQLMLEEAKYRKFIGFSAKRPYPEKVNGKWVVYDPKSGMTDIVIPPKEYLEKAIQNPRYVAMAARTQELREKRKKTPQ